MAAQAGCAFCCGFVLCLVFISLIKVVYFVGNVFEVLRVFLKC